MTCIVGVVHGRHVYLGADASACFTDEFSQHPVRTPKVGRFDVTVNGHSRAVVAGFAESFRMGDLLFSLLEAGTQEEEAWTAPDDCKDPQRSWLVERFVPLLQFTLASGGLRGTRAGDILLGIDGRLFTIGIDYNVLERLTPWAAIGSGHLVALGNLHATSRIRDPHRRLSMALDACASELAYILPPFTVVSTGAPK